VIFTRFQDIPLMRYGLIMADPPWLFKNWSSKGEKKNPLAHYDCLPVETFADWPVSHLAAPNCLLWMWATNPMLPHALDVMKAWGFTFVTAGHWVKRTKNGHLQFGTGYRLRSAGEPFLIGTIGNPKTTRSVRSVIDAKVREHSRKPDEAYAAAEQLVPGVWMLDMFSRQERPGWDAFGNQADKFEVAA
jgi:N6-adenosine-specific RNA methylase IME4